MAAQKHRATTEKKKGEGIFRGGRKERNYLYLYLSNLVDKTQAKVRRRSLRGRARLLALQIMIICIAIVDCTHYQGTRGMYSLDELDNGRFASFSFFSFCSAPEMTQKSY